MSDELRDTLVRIAASTGVDWPDGDSEQLSYILRIARAALVARPHIGDAGEGFLSQLRRVNTDRYRAWVGDGQDAGILFDAAELGGEVGELLNVVKKLVREEAGWRGSRAAPEDFADECADVLICLDKLARRRGVDLTDATIRKFNATSDKQGFPHKLARRHETNSARGDGCSNNEDGLPIIAPGFAVPDGMVLVPREPTLDMARAGCVNIPGPRHPSKAAKVWSAMIAAASPEHTGEKR